MSNCTENIEHRVCLHGSPASTLFSSPHININMFFCFFIPSNLLYIFTYFHLIKTTKYHCEACLFYFIIIYSYHTYGRGERNVLLLFWLLFTYKEKKKTHKDFHHCVSNKLCSWRCRSLIWQEFLSFAGLFRRPRIFLLQQPWGEECPAANEIYLAGYADCGGGREFALSEFFWLV